MKRWKRGEMLDHLRNQRAVTATSLQLGHSRAHLSGSLAYDPEGFLSPNAAAEILSALEAVQAGIPTA